MKIIQYLYALLLIAVAPSAWASGLMPLVAIYFDSNHSGEITLGIANSTKHHYRNDYGYYADITYAKKARYISVGMLATGEGETGEQRTFRGGLTFMQDIANNRHQNYLGISLITSSKQYVSIKFSLLSQVGNPADIRPVLAVGFGI